MIGRTVGHFRIVAKLGEGGMGSVWKAEDTLLGRSIALKFLPAALTNSPEARRRFLREAQAASALEHAGIATVHEAGEADGRVYIAMQLVDGETVGDLVSRGPLRVAEAVRIATSAAEALAHAHARGVLHRDISARNIMVHREARVVVVDFGLALPEGQTRLTETGATMGTVAYLAPEVVTGHEADRRSDLYGLGVVLYEMLTGTLPFTGERSEAVLYATVNTPPQPPSSRRPETRDLDRVVLKLLAKDPARRYQSARELLADLHGLEPGPAGAAVKPRDSLDKSIPIGEAPTDEIQVSVWDLEGRRKHRVRPVLGAVLLIAVLLAVVLGRSVIPPKAPRAPVQPSVAVLPLRNVSPTPSESDFLSQGISEALVTRLAELPNLQVTPWITSQRYGDLSRPLPEVAKELGVGTLIVGTFRKLGDSLQTTVTLVDGRTGFTRWAGNVEGASGDLFAVQRRLATEVARRLRGKLTGDEETNLARPIAHSADAYEHYLKGQAASAGGDLQSNAEALAFFERALELDSALAEAHVGTGAMLTQRYMNAWEGGVRNLGLAETHFQNALRIDPKSAAARRGLILFYFYQGKEEDVLKQGQEVEKLHLDDVEHLLARAEAYVYGTLWDQAISLCQRILQLDPANQPAQFDLAESYVSMGKYEEGIVAANLFLSRFGDDTEMLMLLGWAYHCLGNLQRAQASYARAYGILPEFVPTRITAAIAFSQGGQPDSARAAIQQVIEILTNELNLYPENPLGRSTLAFAYGLLGRKEQVMREERRLLEVAAENGFVWIILGRAHAVLGEPQSTFEYWRRGLRLGCRYQILLAPCLEIIGCENLRSAPGYRDFMRDYEREGERRRALYAPAGAPP